MDFTKLDWSMFEVLIARLLSVSGYKIFEKCKPGARGPDMIVGNPDGSSEFVDLIHLKNSSHLLKKLLADVERYSEFDKAYNLLLVTSNEISKVAFEKLSKKEKVRILGPSWIKDTINKHPSIEKEFSAIISAQDTVKIPLKIESFDVHENSLILELKNLPPGKDHWKKYEDTCIKILNYLFLNPLAPPKIQSRTEDGLDIRDAIYPIRPGNQYWDTLRIECRSRFMVAEFKNYTDSPSQKEVKSLQQYLYPKAMRSFGILCARKQANESALKQRRRAWVENEKLMIILSDQELIEMMKLKSSGEEPFELIDTQLEDFFSVLCP
jgi:hypothetical protein